MIPEPENMEARFRSVGQQLSQAGSHKVLRQVNLKTILFFTAIISFKKS